MKTSLLFLHVWVALVSGAGVGVMLDQVGVMLDQMGVMLNQVGMMLAQVVKHFPQRCHIILASTDTKIPIFYYMLDIPPISHNTLQVDACQIYTFSLAVLSSRLRQEPIGGIVVVDTHSLLDQKTASRDRLLQGLWGEARDTCRALILLCVSPNLTSALRFLNGSKVWLWPETPVVVLGASSDLKSLVLHSSLRNTIHLIYLAVARANPNRRLEPPTHPSLKQDKLSNLMGHKLKIVVLPYFPYIAYDKEIGHPEAPLVPRDSLNIRMLDAIAHLLNFTYEFHEPLDKQWGVEGPEGRWTGVVGRLLHEQADLSLDLTPTASRLAVISFSRIYTDDPLVIVSLKPGPLPRHLALLGPFTGDLWVLVIVSTSAFGVVLWLLEKTWAWVSGGRAFPFSSAVLYSWGTLLEADPRPTPTNLSARVLIVWLLVWCLVVSNGYRSSLVAHLTVQGKTSPINTYQDLLRQREWSWGVRALQGTVLLYFNQTTDPDIREIYKRAKLPPMLRQRYSTAEAIQLLLAGRFSYITFKTDTMMEFDSHDSSPFYTSSTQYPMFAGGAWGIRQGAPFLHNINKMMSRIIESGLVELWLVQLTKKYNSRAKLVGEAKTTRPQGEGARVVLSLDHLQSAFYLLFLGHGAALIALLLEVCLSCAWSGSP
ncbi:glutamate receptor-like [Procambarus clarkii]|uniref:glutamate receptor-like n=1 Tax=Procambarus clarkii TaxID=6728 RepID=UPI00374352AB